MQMPPSCKMRLETVQQWHKLERHSCVLSNARGRVPLESPSQRQEDVSISQGGQGALLKCCLLQRTDQRRCVFLKATERRPPESCSQQQQGI